MIRALALGLLLALPLATPAQAQQAASAAEATPQAPAEAPPEAPAETPAEASADASADGAEEPPAPPPPPRAAEVEFGPDDLSPDQALRRQWVSIAPDPEAATRPVIEPTATGAEAMNLRQWYAEGRAAGLAGVFYENRDGGHSRLAPERFPQLTFAVHDEALRAQGAHTALAERFLFRAPVLGNASMAVTGGPASRSLPRLAMTFPNAAATAYVGYVHNHLYVYPGHRDVTAEVDLMPAALPYFVVSRGSSGSDRPHLNALALALASLPPETRRRAEAEGLLAPLLVMLMRRTLAGVTEYASAAAHPPAIERDRIRSFAMMAAAQAITPDTIPPLVRLRVLGEDFTDRNGLSGQGERLFDTPSALARLWRGWAWRRQMVVSAAGTSDPNGRALEFRWFLIAGDPAKVRIEPLDPAGQSARLTIDWHDAPVPPAPGGKPGARVEIGVIAWNGAHYSAPALISVAFPAHERRVYTPGPDGLPRIASIDYDAAGRGAPFDPVLWWTAPWRDTALFDTAGRLAGWRRHHREGGIDLLTPAAPGVHRINETNQRMPVLEWEPSVP